jgi:hypothetical protein
MLGETGRSPFSASPAHAAIVDRYGFTLRDGLAGG